MKISRKRLALSITAAVCAAGALGVALAQSPQPRTDTQPPALPMSTADLQPRIHERAIQIDANRDGFLAAEELQAARAARHAERMQRRMQRIDTNRDGRVSTVEFETAHVARLERADANRDGQITRDEVRAMRLRRQSERADRGLPGRDPNT